MDNKNEVRQGYDELAETYAARHSNDEREMIILDECLDSLSEPIRLLDAGCGPGTPVLRRLCNETTGFGLDFSREQLTIAAETVPTARLVHGDMTNLPIQNDTFDAVTAYNALIHVPLSDHQTVLDEFARVLRSGGCVLLSEVLKEFERTNPNWLDSDVTMKWNMAGAKATREQLRKAGFCIENEWDAPDTGDEEEPKPPFFAARSL